MQTQARSAHGTIDIDIDIEDLFTVEYSNIKHKLCRAFSATNIGKITNLSQSMHIKLE